MITKYYEDLFINSENELKNIMQSIITKDGDYNVIFLLNIKAMKAFNSNQFDIAVKYFQLVTEIEKDFMGGSRFTNLAESLTKINQFEDALITYEKGCNVITNSFDFINHLLSYAEFLNSTKRFDKSNEICNRLGKVLKENQEFSNQNKSLDIIIQMNNQKQQIKF